MVRFILVFLLLGLTGYVGAQEIKIEKSTEKIVYQGKSYYLHTVKAKETLFSICKAYGVSVDEVKALNDKSDNALSIGDVLRIPVVEPFKSIDDKFYYHRMKPKETLYSLSRKFNIKMKRILKDNPEYDVSRPIAEGAVVTEMPDFSNLTSSAARTNSFEAYFADILYTAALHLPVRQSSSRIRHR